MRVSTEIGHFVNRAWVTEGIAPGVVACSHHLGRWRLHEGEGSRWSSARVSLERRDGTLLLREVEGVGPFASADPDSRRIWWSDGGVHQNLAFPVHPDPVSGMHCWHQKVVVARARPEDRYGDVFVDTARSMEVYREWRAKARPGPGPGGLRRPLWLDRPLRPAREMFRTYPLPHVRLCAPGAALLVYRYDLYDREPWPLVALSVGLGAGGMACAGSLEDGHLHVGSTWGRSPPWPSSRAGCEETLKLLAVLALALLFRLASTTRWTASSTARWPVWGRRSRKGSRCSGPPRPGWVLPPEELVRLCGHLVMGGIGGFGVGCLVYRGRSDCAAVGRLVPRRGRSALRLGPRWRCERRRGGASAGGRRRPAEREP